MPVAVLAALALVATPAWGSPRAGSARLVTNAFGFWSPTNPQSHRSRTWDITSGSLFARDGWLWTGPPDGCDPPDPVSRRCTGSAVFRLATHARAYRDATVTFDLVVNRLVRTRRTPPEDWDGVHVWLHFRSQYHLYYASVARRDGKVVIKKKCPGGPHPDNGGTYYELGGEHSGFPIPYGTPMHVGASIRDNSDGSVTISLERDGQTVATATDRGTGCRPIRQPGAVGIRGDNADFEFAHFRA